MLPPFSIVIPCFNEEGRISETLRVTIEYLATNAPKSELIVVNDGSTDGTGAIARKILSEANIATRLLENFPNRGKGAAVRYPSCWLVWRPRGRDGTDGRWWPQPDDSVLVRRAARRNSVAGGSARDPSWRDRAHVGPRRIEAKCPSRWPPRGVSRSGGGDLPAAERLRGRAALPRRIRRQAPPTALRGLHGSRRSGPA